MCVKKYIYLGEVNSHKNVIFFFNILLSFNVVSKSRPQFKKNIARFYSKYLIFTALFVL